MFSSNFRHFLSTPIQRVFLLLLVFLSPPSFGDDTRTWVKKLYPTTGFNSDCDTPVFNLPSPLPPDMHFDFIGLYNPSAPAQGDERDAFALQQSDCQISLGQYVATKANSQSLAFLGMPAPDSRLVNLRTDEVPKVATADGIRMTLPAEGDVAPPFPATNNADNVALTLDEFRNVTGKMKVKCRSNNSAEVDITMRNYQPHEVLTVWAIWLATPPGASNPAVVPLPFGGVPNVAVADRDGIARFSASLSYCPMDVQPNGAQLLLLDISSHLDGSVYGVVPGTPKVQSLFVRYDDPSNSFTSFLSDGIMHVNRGAFPMIVSPRTEGRVDD